MGTPAKPAWRVWTMRLLPWVLTGIIVMVILREYPLSEIHKQIALGDPWALVAPAIVLALTLLLMVSAWDTWVLRGFLGAPTFRDVVRGKAASAVLLTLGYGFGHGGYAVWIARVTGASVAETIGASLYISASDLCALSIVSTSVVVLGDGEVPRALAIAAPAIAATLLSFVLLGPLQLLGAPPVVIRPWSALSRRRQLLSIAGRVGNIVVLITLTWFAANAFGMSLPYAAVATYLPLIILVGSLPINVAGFGPVQGAWVYFFAPWAPGAQIVAFQFLWHLAVGVCLILRGLPFIRRVVREIDEGRKR